MDKYELVEVVDPTLTAEAIKAHTDRVDAIITGQGGAITQRAEPARKKMGHLMKKHADGVFCVAEFQAPRTALRELERQLNLDQESLRHMVTRKQVVKAKAKKKASA